MRCRGPRRPGRPPRPASAGPRNGLVAWSLRALCPPAASRRPPGGVCVSLSASGRLGMICPACRDRRHSECRGGSWCDCQHRPVVPTPPVTGPARAVSGFASRRHPTSGSTRGPAPVLRVNFIASADGAATVDGLSGGLHGPGDKEIFDSLRMACDALIVASGTVRTENYDALRLTGRPAWRTVARTARVPADGDRLRLARPRPGQLVFADAPIRPIVVTHRSGAVAPVEQEGRRHRRGG